MFLGRHERREQELPRFLNIFGRTNELESFQLIRQRLESSQPASFTLVMVNKVPFHSGSAHNCAKLVIMIIHYT